nr:cysteine proteinase inhibitor B-like [Ipomoea batatas]GME18428.1 cysteine proteinase inhibitor B-like [Ipomoea batatas]
MAKVTGLLNLLLVVSVALFLAGYAAAQEAAASGGKTEVSDVKTNAEVQNLGRKAVMEFNKRLNVKVNPENNAKRLVFTEVIKAEKQVVAGEKYFLTIKATSEDGQTKTYESEIPPPWRGGWCFVMSYMHACVVGSNPKPAPQCYQQTSHAQTPQQVCHQVAPRQKPHPKAVSQKQNVDQPAQE